MFGPLNGVRTALVILAGLAAVVAATLGEPVVASVFAVGVGLHGLGWWYLYRQHTDRRTS